MDHYEDDFVVTNLKGKKGNSKPAKKKNNDKPIYSSKHVRRVNEIMGKKEKDCSKKKKSKKII